MKKTDLIRRIQLTPIDNQRLATLCGQLDENLHLIERHLGVEITNRGTDFEIFGKPTSVDKACDTLLALYAETATVTLFSKQKIQLTLKTMQMAHDTGPEDAKQKFIDSTLRLKKTTVEPRTLNQCHLINGIRKNDICFGVGPSGTGKTFLAIACAVAALENEEVSRIVLTRPAVEAGESLGFLPGDLTQKIDPYLKPLYDALYETMGIATVTKLIAQGIIEIAPLAFMRGRTLNDSFIILDESQNSTREQMKMFLTRIGFGSKAVITGDITQVDLPKPAMSGLRHAISLLRGIEGLQFTFFSSVDVVRHPIVQQIVEAYEQPRKNQRMIVELINETDDTFIPAEADFQAWMDAVKAAVPAADGNICITIVDEAESAALNHQYRQKNYPTNVLSFHYQSIPGMTQESLGDLAICAMVVKKEAEEQHKSLLSHFAHMTIHGALHLLGYDHVVETDAEKMEALEIKIMEKLGYQNPYV